MPWAKPQPLESWTPKQQAEWQTEMWTRGKFFAFAWTPGNVPSLTQSTYTMAATGTPDILTNSCVGLRIGMHLKLTAPTVAPAGLVWDCNVLTNDTATIWIQNVSGSDLVAPSGTWTLSGVIV